MNSNKLPIIQKSNCLIEARYKLNIAEQRLILFIIANLSTFKNTVDGTVFDDFLTYYTINVSDIAKMFELELNSNLYEQIQDAAKGLVGKRLDLSKNGRETYTTWLSFADYINGHGAISVEFHYSLKPYLFQLKSHFTQYDLRNIVSFKSQYSIRLYELLKMDAFKESNGQFEKTFEIDELRLIFGLEKKELAFFADFKRRAIEPAINEVSKTDLNITDVQYGKDGRKVTSITFVVKIRATPTQAIEEKEKSDNHPVIDSLIALGFSPEVAKAIKTKHGIKRLERNIAYTLMKEKAGIVKDVPAYLKNAITEDWGGAWETEQAKKATVKKQKSSDLEDAKSSTKKADLDKKARYQAAFDAFLLLPENEQNDLKAAFFNTADSTIQAKIKTAQNKKTDMFASPLVLSPFRFFLISNGF